MYDRCEIVHGKEWLGAVKLTVEFLLTIIILSPLMIITYLMHNIKVKASFGKRRVSSNSNLILKKIYNYLIGLLNVV